MVVFASLWRRGSRTVRRPQLAWSNCVAKECRSGWSGGIATRHGAGQGASAVGAADPASMGEGSRPLKNSAAAREAAGCPDAQRPSAAWCRAEAQASLAAREEARASHSSRDPQAPTSDRPPWGFRRTAGAAQPYSRPTAGVKAIERPGGSVGRSPGTQISHRRDRRARRARADKPFFGVGPEQRLPTPKNSCS